MEEEKQTEKIPQKKKSGALFWILFTFAIFAISSIVFTALFTYLAIFQVDTEVLINTSEWIGWEDNLFIWYYSDLFSYLTKTLWGVILPLSFIALSAIILSIDYLREKKIKFINLIIKNLLILPVLGYSIAFASFITYTFGLRFAAGYILGEEIEKVQNDEIEIYAENSEIIDNLNNKEKLQVQTDVYSLSNAVIERNLFDNYDKGEFFKLILKYYLSEVDFYDLDLSSNAILFKDLIIIQQITDEEEPLLEALGRKMTEDFVDKVSEGKPESIVDVISQDFYEERRQNELNSWIAEYDEYIAFIREAMVRTQVLLEEDLYYQSVYGGEMWDNWVEEDRQLIAEYESLLADYEAARTNLIENKDRVSNELGLFTSPNFIEVVILDTEEYPAHNYIGTLIHETFHYLSDNPEIWYPDFFEEGMTEYLTEKTMEEHFGYNNHLSYENNVEIVTEMINDIGEDKMIELYFSKNEESLKEILNQTYGEEFYEKNELKFQHITFMYDDAAYEMTEEIMEIIR